MNLGILPKSSNDTTVVLLAPIDKGAAWRQKNLDRTYAINLNRIVYDLNLQQYENEAQVIGDRQHNGQEGWGGKQRDSDS